MNEASPLPAPTAAAHASGGGPSTAPAATLARVDSALEHAVGGASPLLVRLRALRRRLEHDRLQLAVLGQFKRGKSTFINALLGAEVLPSGVIPLTAVATFIAARREPLVIVHFEGRQQSEEFAAGSTDEVRNILFRFVAEEANPENRLGVERVDLFFPAAVLASGIVIIDTPGVGSTLLHNTEAALDVLPECDAAFFVVSADPPITQIELEYLRRVKAKTARVFFVLNKIDYLRPDEQRTAVAFLQKVLAAQCLADGDDRIFCISARAGLEAKRSGDRQMLETSGIADLERHLLRTLANEKARWLDKAVRSKAVEIAAQAGEELGLRMCALNMPIEELADKSNAFQDALRSIEEQRRITCDLLAGECRRLRGALETRIDGLRMQTAARLAAVIDASLAGAPPPAWEEAARRSLSAAVQAEFENARAPLVGAFAAEAGAALRGCQDRVAALVGQVRQTAADIFNVPLGPDAEQEAFEVGEDPYWVTDTGGMTFIPDPSRLIDRLLPASVHRSRLRARMIEQAQELIIRNAENLRWAILRGLDDTFRKAIARFEERLDEAIVATRGVIKDTLTRRGDQAFAVQPELDRLAAARAQLAALEAELRGDAAQAQPMPERAQADAGAAAGIGH